MRGWTRGCISTRVVAGVAMALLAHGGDLNAETPDRPTPRWSERWMPGQWDLPEIPVPHWNLPSVDSVLPGRDEHPPVIRKKDSLLDEMSDSAKKGWWRTKAALHPSRLHPGRLFADDAGAAGKRTSRGGTEADSPGFLGSIFGGSERRSQRPERTAVIEDFMSRPRPRR